MTMGLGSSLLIIRGGEAPSPQRYPGHSPPCSSRGPQAAAGGRGRGGLRATSSRGLPAWSWDRGLLGAPATSVSGDESALSFAFVFQKK